jgi:hypothetical protein
MPNTHWLDRYVGGIGHHTRLRNAMYCASGKLARQQGALHCRRLRALVPPAATTNSYQPTQGQVPAGTANSKLILSGSFEERDVVTSHAADAESDGNELPILTSYVI